MKAILSGFMHAVPWAHRYRRTVLPAMAWATLTAASAGAQESTVKELTVEEVVVTGTHIRGTAPAGAQIVQITAEDIVLSGRATVADVLRELPQNFQGGVESDSLSIGSVRIGNNGQNLSAGQGINLRGLGALSTLTLVNGHRIPGAGQQAQFADVSNIPVAAVERVEVLTDGASALYGSDAVGGVVNIILKRNFDGSQTTVRGGGTSRGGHSLQQISHLWGTSGANGDLLIGYEFNHTTPIDAHDRLYASGGDFTSQGGINWARLNNHFGSQANLTGAAAGASAPVNYVVPPNHSGVGLAASELLPVPPNAFSYYDPYEQVELTPEQTRHSLFAAGNRTVSAGFELYGDLRYTRRDASQKEGYATLGNQGVGVRDSSPFFISNATNLPGLYSTRSYRPGLPAEQLINVNYLVTEKAIDSDYEVDSYGVTFGGRIDLFADWEADVALSYGAEDQFRSAGSLRSRANVVDTIAINGVGVPAPNSLDCALMGIPSTYSGNDPTKQYCAGLNYVPFNPFTSLADNSPEAVNQVIGYEDLSFLSQTWQATAKMDGTVLTLPSGALKLAVGADIRKDILEGDLWYNSASIAPRYVKYDDHDRTIAALFAEASVPLVNADMGTPLVHRLDLSVAGRYEHYAHLDSTFDPKLGLRWEPIGGLSFRTAWGTSYRAPGLRERDEGPAPIAGGNGLSLSDRSLRVLCGTTLVPQNTTGPAGSECFVTNIGVSGGNADLRSESAETWTVGLDFGPSFAPGLHVAVNYFDIAIEDRIVLVNPGNVQGFLNDVIANPNSVFAEVFTFNPTPEQIQALLADPRYSGQNTVVFRQPSDVVLISRATYRNFGALEESGLDATIAYDFAAGDFGHFNIRLNATKVFKYDLQAMPGAPFVDMLDRYEGALPSLVSMRGQGRLSWRLGGLNASATVSYVGPYWNYTVYELNAAGTAAVLQPGERRRIDSWTTLDLTVGYDLGTLGVAAFEDTIVTLAVLNAFNEDPPFVDGGAPGRARPFAFDGANADGRGRFGSLQIVKRW